MSECQRAEHSIQWVLRRVVDDGLSWASGGWLVGGWTTLAVESTHEYSRGCDGPFNGEMWRSGRSRTGREGLWVVKIKRRIGRESFTHE